MRPQLVELLRQAGIEEALGGSLSWRRIVVLRSTGRLSIPDGVEPLDGAWDRGMHLLILDVQGVPRFYCKCRPRRPGHGKHPEGRLLEFFSRHPDSRDLVPHAVTVMGAGIQVQVAEVIRGTRLDIQILSSQHVDIHRTLSDALSAATRLSHVATELFGGRHCNSMVDVAEEAAPLIVAAAGLGIDEPNIQLLAKLLREAGEVVAMPQHGDFWGPNIFVTAYEDIRVVDLDGYGRVRVPMHDAFHLVRTTSDLLAGESGHGWIKRIVEAEGATADLHKLVVEYAEGAGCARTQLLPLLLFYLLEVFIETHRRGGPEAFWALFRNDLKEALEVIGCLGPLEALHRLFPPSLSTKRR